MFLVKQFLKQLVLSPTPWIVLLILVGLFWRRRWARKLFWAAIVVILALHSVYVETFLRYPLESRYPPVIDPRTAEPYDAIVVLMAGTTPAGGLIPFPKISESLFNRLDEAWRLYRLDPKPIVVSGGHVDPLTVPENENQIARDYLIRWGVPVKHVIAEDESRDTFESAIAMQKLLQQKGWKRYLLVTSAIHMPRSMLAFQSIAPQAIAAPGDFTAVFSPAEILPNEDAAAKILASAHEYLGIVFYRWRLRFYEK
jgi:uncharacterized SAM-binding protein YcdF (DUF218 family)